MELGLVGDPLLGPVWVCPPLVARSPVALGLGLLPNLPRCLSGKIRASRWGRCRYSHCDPMFLGGSSPLH